MKSHIVLAVLLMPYVLPAQVGPTKPSSKKEDCCVLEPLIAPDASAGRVRKDAVPRLVEGNVASHVRVIVYEDLQCPDCAAFRKAMDEVLLPRYGRLVAFEHRDFPLPKHSWAKEAAVAARYFQNLDPDVALEFRRRVLGRIGAITSQGFRQALAEFCREKGLDWGNTLAALSNEKYVRAVEEDFQEGIAAGVRRTPTAIAAGRTFVETIDLGEFQRLVDGLLAAPAANQ